MSFRSNMVDHLLTLTPITDIVDDRVSDVFYTFEDLMNSDANDNAFPAVSVSQSTTSTEQTLDNFPRSRAQSVRDKERIKVTEWDTLTDAVEDALNALSGEVGDFIIRDSKLRDIRDEEFTTDKNRKILAHQILIDFIITKK